MSLAKMFAEVLEAVENPELKTLSFELCKKSREYRIAGSSEERRFMAVMKILIGVADYETRQFLAKELIQLPDFPRDLYLYCACDDFTIAEPFLAPSFALDPDQVLHVAKYAGKSHRLALLDRDDLSPETIREIMKHNEVDVIQKMNEQEATAFFFEYDDDFGQEGDMELDDMDTDLSQELQIENPLDLKIKSYVSKSRFADIIELLATQGGLPKGMVKSLFMKSEAEPISILCKGLGMGTEAFTELARFRCRRLGQLERLGDQAVDAYAELGDAYAEAMLDDLKAQSGVFVRRAT